MVESPGRITLWGIEVFVATAEEGAISAAARRLGASPSAVSQQLTNLEGALGTTLLHRNARPVALTPAGEVFRRRAGAILNEAAQARAELAMADMASLTRFRFGMIEDLETDVTPRLLTGLAADLKSAQFLLETGASHHLHDQLDARALDLIVAADMGADMGTHMGGDTRAEADCMEVHPLLTEGFVVAAPRGRIDPARDLLAQLKLLPLVQYTTRHYMGRLLAAHLARQNLTLASRFELDSYHAILALVAQGAGWTILTPLALRRARRFADAIDVMPLPVAPLTRTISLTARRATLGDLPARVAADLRPLLAEAIVAPVIAAYPFMASVVQVLHQRD